MNEPNDPIKFIAELKPNKCQLIWWEVFIVFSFRGNNVKS